MSTLLEQMKKDLYDGKADKVKAATKKALAEGMTPPRYSQQRLDRRNGCRRSRFQGRRSIHP